MRPPMNGSRRTFGYGVVLAMALGWHVTAVHGQIIGQQTFVSGWQAVPTFNETWNVDRSGAQAVPVQYTIVNQLYVVGTVVNGSGVERAVGFRSTADFTITFPKDTFSNFDPVAQTTVSLGAGVDNNTSFGDQVIDALNDVSGTASTTGVLADGTDFFGVGTVPVNLAAAMSSASPGAQWHNLLVDGTPSPFGFVDDAKARFLDGSFLFQLRSTITITALPEAGTSVAVGFVVVALAWARRWHNH
jgi:hypothetical protein